MSSKTDNLVHIQFGYDSALETKRDIISSELNLVRMSKIINKYKDLRTEEFKIKEMISRRLKVLKIDFGALQNLLPHTRAPAIIEELQREHNPYAIEEMPEEETEVETSITKEKKEEKLPEEDSLESQLAEIQKRLASISG